MAGEKFPIRKAEQFVLDKENGFSKNDIKILNDQLDEIKRKNFDDIFGANTDRKKLISKVNRGVYIEMIWAHNLQNKFIKMCWPYGNEFGGKSYIKKCLELKNRVLKYSSTSQGDVRYDTMKSESDNYLPTKSDCNTAIEELDTEGQKGTDDNVLDRIKKNLIAKGFTLHPDWRKITLKNMKKWSS